MQPFTRPIERVVTIRSGVPTQPDTKWVLTLSDRCLEIRRKGGKPEAGLTWREIIGFALIHKE